MRRRRCRARHVSPLPLQTRLPCPCSFGQSHRAPGSPDRIVVAERRHSSSSRQYSPKSPSNQTGGYEEAVAVIGEQVVAAHPRKVRASGSPGCAVCQRARDQALRAVFGEAPSRPAKRLRAVLAHVIPRPH